MFHHLLALVLFGLSCKPIPALNIPQSPPDVSQSQRRRQQQSTTNLGSSPKYECIRDSHPSAQPLKISDCKAAIKRLPRSFPRDPGEFHYLGANDGFRLPQSRREGTCKLEIEMITGCEQETGSWEAIISGGTNIMDACGDEPAGFTGGWTTQGFHSGIIIRLVPNDDTKVTNDAVDQPNSMWKQAVSEEPLNPADPEPHTTQKRAVTPALPSLPSQNLTTNLTTPATGPFLKCKTRSIFGFDKRAPFDDCRIAIIFLPLLLGTGFFHTGEPSNDYQLPVRRTWETCAIVVNLREGVSGVESSWLDVQKAGERLVDVCRVPSRKWGEDVTGGKISAGTRDGLIIKLGSIGKAAARYRVANGTEALIENVLDDLDGDGEGVSTE